MGRRLRLAAVRWFSRRVGAARRERLARALRAPARRRLLLGLIFTAMPRAVRRSAREGERVVIEWRVTGRRDGHPDVRQLVIGDGSAALFPGEQRDPDLVITVGGVDLLLVATGNASAPALFVRGELEIDGDPWLALRLPTLFGL